jgi:phosphatidylglycerophosphatase A
VDEVVGQWIVLSAVAPDNWLHWLAAFVLFRLLDIFKPYPIRRLERLPKGIGVVADDVGAGLCGMIILVVLRRFLES